MRPKISVELLRNFIVFIFLTAPFFCQAQEKVILSGHITDSKTKMALQGVNVIVSKENGTTTDGNGIYSIRIPPGDYTITINYLGYQSLSKTVSLKQDESLDFVLTESTENLSEVVIQKNKETVSLRKPQMSVAKLNASTIKELPTVLGETDVIKSLLLLPGVTNGGEAASGFNVRGGSSDQNLVLLDQATLFNQSHLFGFFSVFNADAIKNLTLYKGGIPSKYGGRASSVLDIQQRIGNRQKFHANGGIGIVSSQVLAEGPIEKGKSSFLIAGRSSYAHLFLKLADNPNSAYFYDLNAKVNDKLNENNSLYFSGYFGRDIFSISDSFKNKYGNAVADFRWEHRFLDNLTSNLYAIYSDFYYGLTLDFGGFNYHSGIRNFNLKYDFEHRLSDDFSLDYGINSKYFIFDPGYIEPSDEDSGIVKRQLTKKYAWENAAYVQAEQQLSEKIVVSYGLRLNSFTRLGQDKINVYKNNQPVKYNAQLSIYEKAPILNSYRKAKNHSVKTFVNLEPRASVSYKFNKNNAIKANYQRLNQYLQLLSNTNTPTPLDVWAPSGQFIKPLQADQVALGYFHDFEKSPLRLETEVFYKKIKNRIDYINGADLIANNAIEQVILNGNARAYGLEFLLKKTTGDFTGWISYTLSKAEQKTPGRTAQEPGINNGNWYNAPWDKTHDISVTGNYKFNKKWSFNAAFVYQTGQPATYPVSQYEYDSQIVPDYGSRNSSRLPDFHHLDISATLTPKHNPNHRWHGQWIFSIYNVYNRQNAASINFAENEDTGVNEATRLSIFGIIPSVSYKFNF